MEGGNRHGRNGNRPNHNGNIGVGVHWNSRNGFGEIIKNGEAFKI